MILTKSINPLIKRQHRFFASIHIPHPHSELYLMEQERIFKQLNIPTSRATLAQGARVYLCDTLLSSAVVLQARPMFLCKDSLSISAAEEELNHMLNTYRASMIEFELRQTIECLVTNPKPQQFNYYLHFNVLLKKEIRRIPEVLSSDKPYNP